MAEIDTSVYKNMGANNQNMNPLQIMQLMNAVNQNKLFQQTYDARQKLGEAYKANVSPEGKINAPGLSRDVAQSGFLAPEAVGQGISNSTAQFGLDTKKLDYAQKTLGAIASKPDLKSSDFAGWAANAARAGVDPSTISGVLDSVY